MLYEPLLSLNASTYADPPRGIQMSELVFSSEVCKFSVLFGYTSFRW